MRCSRSGYLDRYYAIVTVHGYAVHSNRMHTKWADRPFWRCDPQVSCDLCPQETPRGILPVKSNMRYLLYMRDRPGYLTCGNTGGIIHLCADTLRHGRQAYIRGNEKARGAKGKQRRAEKEAGEILWDRDRKKVQSYITCYWSGDTRKCSAIR